MKDETLLGYTHAKIQTKVVLICDSMHYQLDHRDCDTLEAPDTELWHTAIRVKDLITAKLFSLSSIRLLTESNLTETDMSQIWTPILGVWKTVLSTRCPITIHVLHKKVNIQFWAESDFAENEKKGSFETFWVESIYQWVSDCFVQLWRTWDIWPRHIYHQMNHTADMSVLWIWPQVGRYNGHTTVYH